MQGDRHLHGEATTLGDEGEQSWQQRLVTGEELQRGVGEDEIERRLGDQVAMSCLTKRAAGTRWRACASIASDVSRPTMAASAKRSASSSALLPGPQPRSATRRGASSGTPASRSRAARVRSATNFM
jgi:hypothetical protein